MKHTMKRVAALLIALLIAMPTFTVAEAPAPEELQAPVVEAFFGEAMEVELEPPQEEQVYTLGGTSELTDGMTDDEAVEEPLPEREGTVDAPEVPLEQAMSADKTSGPAPAEAELSLAEDGLRVSEASDDAFAAAVEQALGVEGIAVHRLYRVEAVDAVGNVVPPDFVQDVPMVRIEGLGLPEDAQVACRDDGNAEICLLNAAVNPTEDFIEFPFMGSTLYDIVTVEAIEASAPEEVELPPEELVEAAEFAGLFADFGEDDPESEDGKLRYTFSGDPVIPVSDILSALGLTAEEVHYVAVSAADRFSAQTGPDGEWTVTAHRSFDSEESMTIDTSDGTYEIVVTDDQRITTWAELQEKINNLHDNETLNLTDDLQAGDGDAAITIAQGKKITLALNGHTLNRNLAFPAKDGSTIIVNGELRLEGYGNGNQGLVTGANADGTGGGLLVNAGGALTVKDVTISDNYADVGGGVCVYGRFEMEDSTVEYNTGQDNGGGVYVGAGGEFTLNSGHLIDNSGSDVWLCAPMKLSGDVEVGQVFIPAALESQVPISVEGKLTSDARVGIGVDEGSVDDSFVVTSGLNANGSLDNFPLAEEDRKYIALSLNDAGEIVLGKITNLMLCAGLASTETVKIPVAKGGDYSLPGPEVFQTFPDHLDFESWCKGDPRDKDATHYYPGDGIQVNDDVTLTACWDLSWSGMQGMIDACPDQGTITLPCDVSAETNDTEALKIDAGKRIIIDLNGYSLYGTDKLPAVLNVSGMLTLADGHTGGAITGGVKGVAVTGNGRFTLRGGKFPGTKNAASK